MKKIAFFVLIFLYLYSEAQVPPLSWAKQIGGSGSETGYSVVTDSSGNVFTGGNFQGTVDFDPGSGTHYISCVGTQNIFITKYDNNGNFIWAKTIGGTGVSGGIYGMTVDSVGNIIATGVFMGTADFDPSAGVSNLTSAGSQDIFVAKYDNNGNLLWAKSFGSTKNEAGRSVTTDSAGNVYFGGEFQGTIDFDPSSGTANLTSDTTWFDGFYEKLDASGNFVWVKQIAGSSTESVYDVHISGNNLYLTGIFVGTVDFNPNSGTSYISSNDGGQDGFLCKMDTSGNFVWAKNLGDATDSSKQDASGNVYVAGYFSGSSDFDPGVGTVTLTSNGSLDIFLEKLDANGNYVWAKNIGGLGQDQPVSIVLDNASNIYLAGIFQNTVDFDPNSGVFNVIANGSLVDGYVAKYTSSGNFVYAGGIGSTQIDNAYSIALDNNNSVFVSGIFQQTADLDPTSTVLNFVSYGAYDAFTLKIASTTLSTQNSEKSKTQIYPNPFTEILNISSENNGAVQFYDTSGKLVTTEKLTKGSNFFNKSSLKSGVYIYQIKNMNGEIISSGKVIKR